MDAKTRDLALLGFLSLFCAVSAWAGDRDVVRSFFFALGVVAVVSGVTLRARSLRSESRTPATHLCDLNALRVSIDQTRKAQAGQAEEVEQGEGV